MKDASLGLGYGLKFLPMKDMDDITKKSLVEKHIIDSKFEKKNNKYSAIIINEEENICILVNAEEHIKIQTFSAGLDLENTLNLAIEIDKKLEDYIQYSYNQKYGYLTQSPTDVGTGLRATLYFHLPALTIINKIKQVSNVVNNLGVKIRSLYVDNENHKFDFYRMNNNQTLGITEKDIIKGVKIIAQKVMDQERQARKRMSEDALELENKVYRLFGILLYAKRIGEEEVVDLLSLIKLGTDYGIIKELNDSKVLELLLYTRTANMQKRLGKKIPPEEQAIERANLIKQIINN